MIEIRAASVALFALLVTMLPYSAFSQQQEALKILPTKPKLEIRSIEAVACAELKTQLTTVTNEDRVKCSGTAYTQRPRACITIAEKSIAIAQSQLTKVARCPELNADYARAIILNSRSNLKIFEAYVEELARPEPSNNSGSAFDDDTPRRCWLVSQQCQECNINGCFPYVCNSRTECE